MRVLPYVILLAVAGIRGDNFPPPDISEQSAKEHADYILFIPNRIKPKHLYNKLSLHSTQCGHQDLFFKISDPQKIYKDRIWMVC